MKTTITALLLFSVLSSFGQLNSMYNYPSRIGASKIKYLKIREINVWEHKCDTLGTIIDTTLSMKYLYDTNGLLIETRSGYTKDHQYHSWTKYFYNKNGYLIDKKKSVRWEPIDGVYKPYPRVYYIRNKYEVDDIVESEKYYADNPDKIVAKETYEYDTKAGLLTRTMFYYGGKLHEIQIIEYIKWGK